MGMSAFVRDGRRLSQFGVDRTVRFRERMNNFLRDVFGDDLGRVGFSISVFKNESRLRRFRELALGRSRKEQTASRDRNQTGRQGTGFRHKERDLSSRIAAGATDFHEKK
jgi:hypothetical protein